MLTRNELFPGLGVELDPLTVVTEEPEVRIAPVFAL